jgi:hypothetical protein
MAKTRAANPATAAEAIAQLQEMKDGARSELAAGRRKSAGTLAIAGAVRAVDLICDAALGRHSVAPSHSVALDLLASVPGAENAVENFSLCQTRKSDYNYHVSDINDDEVISVIEAAESLAEECQARLRDKGWA